jgi:hypothetical protein
MKQLIARTFTALMLVVTGLTMAAHAQSTSVIKVNIPFEFNFGDRTFPAGDYTLVQPLDHVLALRDARGQTIAHALAEGIESNTPATSTEVKFGYSGEQRVLTEVWQKFNSSGLRMFPVKDNSDVAMHRSTESRETAEGSRP